VTAEPAGPGGQGEQYPVYLRPLTGEDAATAHPWWRDPVVQGHSGAPLGPEDPDEFRRFFCGRYVCPDPKHVATGIVVRETDRLIGIVVGYIEASGREAEYGIKIGDRNSWGKGYGTAATRAFADLMFQTTEIDAIYGLVELTNERAKRALISAGFRVCCLMYNKEFLRVDLTREEWAVARERAA